MALPKRRKISQRDENLFSGTCQSTNSFSTLLHHTVFLSIYQPVFLNSKLVKSKCCKGKSTHICLCVWENRQAVSKKMSIFQWCTQGCHQNLSFFYLLSVELSVGLSPFCLQGDYLISKPHIQISGRKIQSVNGSWKLSRLHIKSFQQALFLSLPTFACISLAGDCVTWPYSAARKSGKEGKVKGIINFFGMSCHCVGHTLEMGK